MGPPASELFLSNVRRGGGLQRRSATATVAVAAGETADVVRVYEYEFYNTSVRDHQAITLTARQIRQVTAARPSQPLLLYCTALAYKQTAAQTRN